MIWSQTTLSYAPVRNWLLQSSPPHRGGFDMSKDTIVAARRVKGFRASPRRQCETIFSSVRSCRSSSRPVACAVSMLFSLIAYTESIISSGNQRLITASDNLQQTIRLTVKYHINVPIPT